MLLLFSGRTVYVCTYSCQVCFCRLQILWKVLWQTVINETPVQVSTTAGPDGVYWLQSSRINCDPSAPSHFAGDPSCTFYCAQLWCHTGARLLSCMLAPHSACFSPKIRLLPHISFVGTMYFLLVSWILSSDLTDYSTLYTLKCFIMMLFF